MWCCLNHTKELAEVDPAVEAEDGVSPAAVGLTVETRDADATKVNVSLAVLLGK